MGADGSGEAGTEAGEERPGALRDLLAAMPKAELHLHLDGGLRIETALELARSRGVDAPTTAAGMRAALVAPERCASQAELLRAFDLPIALLQDAEALERVAAELVDDKAADRVRYLEVRWAPALHTARGLGAAEVIEAVARGAADAARRTGTTLRLLCTAMRSHPPAANVRLAEVAAGCRHLGLAGFDLAGPEEAFPDPAAHRGAIEAARAGGLGITLHAGEWGGAAQVRAALALNPARIAHGPGAVDDPALCAELRARAVTLDLCPTSNVQAGIVPSLAAHPLAILHRRGVPVTLSVDDPTVGDVSLSEEYRRAVEDVGLSLAELWAIDRHALDVAFADEAALAPLRTEFDAWAAARTELRAGQAGSG
ncbi:MAG TPA: adenosine deaminase [Candidatus Limnocylindrales bacterium]